MSIENKIKIHKQLRPKLKLDNRIADNNNKR